MQPDTRNIAPVLPQTLLSDDEEAAKLRQHRPPSFREDLDYALIRQRRTFASQQTSQNHPSTLASTMHSSESFRWWRSSITSFLYPLPYLARHSIIQERNLDRPSSGCVVNLCHRGHIAIGTPLAWIFFRVSFDFLGLTGGRPLGGDWASQLKEDFDLKLRTGLRF